MMQKDTHTSDMVGDKHALPAPRRSGVLWMVGGVMLLALLAGAAFVAARLLGGEVPLSSGDVVFGPGTDLGLLPPTQVPVRPPDLEGPFQQRDDNSLFVARPAADGPVNAAGGGPVTEVVITQETLIYADVTSLPSSGDVIEGGTIQLQAQQVDNIEEIGEGTILMVWGEWRGDRLFATVIYYDQL